MRENFQGDSWGSIPPLCMPSLLPHDLCHGRSSLHWLLAVIDFQLSYSRSWNIMLWKCCTQYAICNMHSICNMPAPCTLWSRNVFFKDLKTLSLKHNHQDDYVYLSSSIFQFLRKSKNLTWAIQCLAPSCKTTFSHKDIRNLHSFGLSQLVNTDGHPK